MSDDTVPGSLARISSFASAQEGTRTLAPKRIINGSTGHQLVNKKMVNYGSILNADCAILFGSYHASY